MKLTSMRSRRRGATAVETALVLSVFILSLFSAFVLQTEAETTNAAQQLSKSCADGSTVISNCWSDTDVPNTNAGVAACLCKDPFNYSLRETNIKI